jgi:hypothetical protein
MAYELIYTSAQQGLRAGSRGFCTVAHTEGMPSALIQLAESLSGYRHLYQPHDPLHARNPVAYSHYAIAAGGEDLSVLSRVAACGTDYSGRTNKLAHHVILPTRERLDDGPAAIMLAPSFFVTEWSRAPQVLPAGRAVTASPMPSFQATAWAAACGDAGWAGVLAGSWLEGGGEDVYIIFNPAQQLLPLIAEAIHLLPPAERWKVTFCTHFTSCPTGTTCRWRCCTSDSEEHRAALGRRRGLLIDLSKPLGPAPDGPLTGCARTGATPGWMHKPAPRPAPPPASVARPAAPAPAARPAPAPVPDKAEPSPSRGRRTKVTIARQAMDSRVPGGGSRHSGLSPAAIGMFVAAAALVIVGIFIVGRPSRSAQIPKPAALPVPAVTNVAVPSHVDIEPPKDIEPVPPTPATQLVAVVSEPPHASTGIAVHVASPVLVSRIKGAGAIVPLSVELPQDLAWRDCGFSFFGRDGIMAIQEPRRDIDRLENRVRRLSYTLPAAGWSASIQDGAVRFDPPAGGVPSAGHGIVCVRARPPRGAADVLLWITGLMATGSVERAATESQLVVSVAADETVSLLASALSSDNCTCMAVFEKPRARVAVPFSSSCGAGRLCVTAEVENVAAELAKQERTAALESRAGVASRGQPVDYSAMKALLEKIRKSAGDAGETLSTARRMNVCRDLKILLVEEGESKLLRLPADSPDATHLDGMLEKIREKILDMVSPESKSRHRSLDRKDASEDHRSVKERSAARAAYFKSTILAGNQALTPDILFAFIESDELRALAQPPAATRGGDDLSAEVASPAAEKQTGLPLPDRLDFLVGEGRKDCVLSVRLMEGAVP